ncbi:threonine/serine exporter family protein [Granulicella sp. WH15]|uniref:threonine/serine ThrE exporter family protein n=1 Tax=Granulicella sp. WH15 TaxID=2602070 RepID=UPI0013673580|nr:threonine/serine exporter family protein [Granulicella sp. WH15]QHN03594.1 threonine/serine exporter family protein [Granulicella sp. WH15]
MTAAHSHSPGAEEVAHLSLELGRQLTVSGADSAHVKDSVERFARGLGYEAHLLITYEALLLTVIANAEFRTKVGTHIPGTGVNMTAVESLNRITNETASGLLDATTAGIRLAALEHSSLLYPNWLVAISLGLTGASLSRLFGGDWFIFCTVFLAATVGTAVRQQLGHWRAHPLIIPFVSALVSGIIGGLGVKLHAGNLLALCMIAPGMLLVPGVPLINGIRDAINNKMELSIARLSFAALVVVAITLGLFAAMGITGIGIPVSGLAPLLAIPEDAFFSAVTTIGYVFLFNVALRDSWACVICGVCCHALRTALMHLGVDIVSGTLIGSMIAGLLAHLFARHFRTPSVTFAFPSVVALVPGSYAFRTVIGGLQILRDAGNSPGSLVAETISLALYTVLLTCAIAIGLAVALAVPLPGSQNQVGKASRL